MEDTVFSAEQIALGTDDLLSATQTAAVVTAHGGKIAVDRLVKIYVRVREAKAARQKEAEAEIKVFDDQMKLIATELKGRMQAEGVEGYKTEFGTVYSAVDFKTSCQDWGIFYQWIKDNDSLDFLERRISSGKIKDFMDTHEGELPPGVSVFKELQARIRKANEK
jgi:hypothetical protein